MKNKFKFGLLLIVMVVIGVYYVVEKENQTRLAGLVLHNVDALAGGEDGDVNFACLEDGSLNCKGVRAKYMVDSRSLKR